MYCNQCGKELKEGTKFCTGCGAPVDTGSIYSDLSGMAAGQEKPDPSEAGSNMAEADVPPARREISPALNRWLIISAVLCIACAIIYYLVQKGDGTPGSVASRYFVSLVNGDKEAAFDSLGLSRTDWLNPDAFEAYIRKVKDQNPDLSRVKSVSAGEENQAGSNLQVQMDYTYGDAKSKDIYYVYLDQDSDSWQVTPSGMIVENVSISLPKGALGKLNGIELTDKYLLSSDDVRMDEYQIPEMFWGIYEVEVDLDGYEPYTGAVSINGDEFAVLPSDLSVTKDTSKALEKQAGEDLKKLYTAVCAQSGFDSVRDLFTQRTGAQQTLVSGYENQLSSFRSRSPLVSVKMNDLVTETTTGSTDIFITADYTVDFIYSGYSGTSQEQYSGTKTLTMNYVRDEDSWKLASVPDLSLYYY